MMANRLYRWMGFVLMVAMAALSSCTSVAPPLATPTTRPTFTPRPTFTITPPATATPTVTPTVTQTAPPAPTPTIPPVSAGTALPVQREPVYEGNLENLRELARWGNGRVDGMAWSGDGSMIAVSTPLGLYLYQAATLERSMFYQTSAPASHPTFSPDSSQVAAAVALTGQLGVSTVLLWSTEGSSLLLSLPVPGRVLALAFSPGGASLSAISRLDRQDQRGATLTQWELPSGRITSEINLSSGETAEAAAFSASGRFAVTRGPNGPIRLWQLSDGVNFATTQESGRNAGPMAFSPDEKALAVGYIDNVRDYLNQNEIRVWHVPSPEDKRPSYLLYTLFDNVRARGPALAEGMEQVLLSLTWSQDSSKIAAGYEDRTVRVWEAAPSQPFRRLAAATFPFALSFSPDGEQLASGGLEIFDVRNAVLLARTNDFLPGLYDMALSPSGNYLALAGYGLIEVRRVEDGSVAYTITGMEGPVNAVDISADGSLMVAACQDGTTRLYRLSDGRYLASLGAPTYPVLTAAFSANGRWIASGNENMRVQVFRVDDGQVMLDLEEPYVSYRLLFSPNVDQLASLTTAGVWLRSFGGEIQRIQANLMGMTGGVSLSDMSYSPGSEFLALAGNGVVRVILPTTGATEYMISTQSSSLPPGVLPWSVAFSPDNAFLATGWSDGSLRLYWAADGTLMASRSAHPEAILRVTFTRDSRLMVTLGAEGVIRLWGVAGP